MVFYFILLLLLILYTIASMNESGVSWDGRVFELHKLHCFTLRRKDAKGALKINDQEIGDVYFDGHLQDWVFKLATTGEEFPLRARGNPLNPLLDIGRIGYNVDGFPGWSVQLDKTRYILPVNLPHSVEIGGTASAFRNGLLDAGGLRFSSDSIPFPGLPYRALELRGEGAGEDRGGVNISVNVRDLIIELRLTCVRIGTALESGHPK